MHLSAWIYLFVTLYCYVTSFSFGCYKAILKCRLNQLPHSSYFQKSRTIRGSIGLYLRFVQNMHFAKKQILFWWKRNRLCSPMPNKVVNHNRAGLLDVAWVRGGAWISPHLLDHPITLWKPPFFSEKLTFEKSAGWFSLPSLIGLMDTTKHPPTYNLTQLIFNTIP